MTSFKTDNEYSELREFIDENASYFTNENTAEALKYEMCIQCHNKIYTYEYNSDVQMNRYLENQYIPYLKTFCSIKFIRATTPGTGRIAILEFKISLRDAFFKLSLYAYKIYKTCIGKYINIPTDNLLTTFNTLLVQPTEVQIANLPMYNFQIHGIINGTSWHTLICSPSQFPNVSFSRDISCELAVRKKLTNKTKEFNTCCQNCERSTISLKSRPAYDSFRNQPEQYLDNNFEISKS